MERDQPVYLFQCSNPSRYALSLDMTGCNMPRTAGAWLLRGELLPDELPGDFRAAVKHLAIHGFSILKIEEENV